MIDPLKPIPMPSYGVLLGLTTSNSWPLEVGGRKLRMAYVATDSTERFSFVAVQSQARTGQVGHIASRPTLYPDMPHGVVIEVYLADDLGDEERIQVVLAQAGATTYFPPQQIDDLPEN